MLLQNYILVNIRQRRAHLNTKCHCLYGHYFLGLSRSQLAIIYCKSKSTISTWITDYEWEGTLQKTRKNPAFRKFDEYKRQWLVDQYKKNPIMFLDEACHKFKLHFGISISPSSVCNILHAHNLTWKVLERRAIQIRDDDVQRFIRELQCFNWDLFQLVFLDETAFVNNEMLRTKGYGLVGESLIFHGEFRRLPRVSCLTFLGQHGIIENFETEGTFTRQKFFECVKRIATKHNGIRAYPGIHSVWIMDGARIHCDEFIIKYLRSLGIIPIFLPAYCAHFNPIEVIFGLVKRSLQRSYVENNNIPLNVIVNAELTKFTVYDCTKIFKKCGYYAGGVFRVNHA